MRGACNFTSCRCHGRPAGGELLGIAGNRVDDRAEWSLGVLEGVCGAGKVANLELRFDDGRIDAFDCVRNDDALPRVAD